MIRKLLAGMTLGALIAIPASAQTLDEILAKNYQAKGGLDRIKAVNTVRATGTMTLGPGMEVPFVMEQKRPNQTRMEVTIQGATIVQAYDGKAGWMLDPSQGRKTPTPMAEDALRQIDIQADMDGPLVDYKSKGSTLELLGKEKVAGADAYMLKLTLKTGDTIVMYLDADRFLEVKMVAKMKIRGTDVESETSIGDYREVAGMMVAHAMESSQKGAPQKQRMTIKKVEVNVPIDDARFKMPAAR
jgi:outer membrane lipoprotein-sorting protein